MSMKNFINAIFCHFLYRVKYTGLENISSLKRCVICPNHSNIFDPFFIYPITNNVHIMAKSDLFKHKLLAKFFKRYNVFPVDRNRRDPGSLFHAVDIFEKNQEVQLLIFPEGGILKTDDEIGKTIRNEATFIAAHAEVPIIPVYITRRPHLFSKVNVIFGTPYTLDKEILNDKSLLKEKSKELIDKIYCLNRVGS